MTVVNTISALARRQVENGTDNIIFRRVECYIGTNLDGFRRRRGAGSTAIIVSTP